MKQNPYLKRLNKDGIGASGRKAEVKIQKRLGGHLTPGSGNMEGAKGDLRMEDFLVEVKTTVNGSISLKLDWLVKIMDEAMTQGQKPALAVTFVQGNGKPRADGAWIMMPEHVFKELSSS